ncbi:hypothetical protein MHK_011024, partial [Candidatus Magnetomorum sp. HK-1]
ELPYVILEQNNDTNKPFKIGLPSISVNIPKILGRVTNEMDIVFLIDATMSMEPYFEHTSNIAENFMRTFKDKDVRFGIAVYRDYNHKEKCFEKLVDLTKDIKIIKKSLKKKVTTKPEYSDIKNDPALYPEAVFQGIQKCILTMDWDSRSDARRLIIHIGDAGNHSRNKDRINEKDLARLLYQGDFSYSAILLLDDTDELKERIEARNQFYLEMKNLINYTDKMWIDNLPIIYNNNQKKINEYKQQVKKFECNSRTAGSINYSLCNRGRWVLTTVNTTDGYEKTVEKHIKNLSEELKLQIAKMNNLLKNTKATGSKEIVNTNKAFKHKHQLDASFTQRTIKKVGEEMLKKIADGNENIRKKAIQIVQKQDLESATIYIKKRKGSLDNLQRNKLDQVIVDLGKSEFYLYLKKNAETFSTAHVLYNIKNYNLFKKVVLLTRTEIEYMMEPLIKFRDENNGEIERENLLDILKTFLKHIPGEEFFEKTSFEELYYWQRGISLQHEHELLKMPIEEIELGLDNIKAEDLQKLQLHMMNTLANLDKIYTKKPKGDFVVYGITYFWIPVEY